MAIPDTRNMRLEEIVDWVATNDLTELIASAQPLNEIEGPRSEQRPTEVMSIYPIRRPESVRTALDSVAHEQGVETPVLLRQIIERWAADHDDADASG